MQVREGILQTYRDSCVNSVNDLIVLCTGDMVKEEGYRRAEG